MTRSDIEELLEQHKAAFKRRDVEALADNHAPDGTFESPAHGLVHGRPGILSVYRYWFSAFPDLDLTWDSVIIDGARAAFFWTLTGTTAGPFFGVTKPGMRVTMVGAADYRFAQGYITTARHVYDFSGVLLQVGVLKARP